MAFTIPDGLAPEIFPLAWLLGTWEGTGTVGYADHIPASTMRQRAVFTHDGGPYLAYTSTVWLTDGDGVDTQLWHTESGYWRIAPAETADDELEVPADPASQHGGEQADRGAQPAPQAFQVEVLMAEPAGFVTVFIGEASPARIDMGSDIVARTRSAARVDASRRMYGLVEGDLLWAWDIAAFGAPMASYMAARLARQPEDG